MTLTFYGLTVLCSLLLYFLCVIVIDKLDLKTKYPFRSFPEPQNIEQHILIVLFSLVPAFNLVIITEFMGILYDAINSHVEVSITLDEGE